MGTATAAYGDSNGGKARPPHDARGGASPTHGEASPTHGSVRGEPVRNGKRAAGACWPTVLAGTWMEDPGSKCTRASSCREHI